MSIPFTVWPDEDGQLRWDAGELIRWLGENPLAVIRCAPTFPLLDAQRSTHAVDRPTG